MILNLNCKQNSEKNNYINNSECSISKQKRFLQLCKPIFTICYRHSLQYGLISEKSRLNYIMCVTFNPYLQVYIRGNYL